MPRISHFRPYLILIGFSIIELLPLAGPSRAGLVSIPTTAEQAPTSKLIHELFAKDYADHSVAARQALAVKLLKTADDGKADTAAYYVLVNLAFNAAIDAGDIDTSLDCIALLGARYTVDASALESDLVQRIPAKLPQAGAESFTGLCLTLADINSRAGHFDAARQIALMAGQAANSTKKPAVIETTRKRVAEILVAQQQSRLMDAALKRLETDPNDEMSLVVAGKAYCFTNHDWAHGLPLLARSSDPTLGKLAALDLHSANTAPGCMAIANQYWEVAAKEQEPNRSAFQQRAAYWYEKVLPQSEGLEKVLAKKRIEEANVSANGHTADITSGTNGHRYQRFDGPVRWHVARLLCTQARGHLIIIPSEEVQALANKLAADRNTWIGATDEEKQGDWHWVDGSSLVYSHWGPGQPDNHDGVQHWGYIYRGDVSGPWDDMQATEHFAFICEWDGGK